MKRLAFLIALALLPGSALAQQHDHAKAEAAKPAAGHMNFARELVAAKADLKLTAEQIKKLEVFAVKMDDMHKKMAAHGDHAKTMTHGDAATSEHKMHGDAANAEHKMHADLLAIFTEEQLVKVRPLMKAHMEKCEHMMKGEKKHGHH